MSYLLFDLEKYEFVSNIYIYIKIELDKSKWNETFR